MSLDRLDLRSLSVLTSVVSVNLLGILDTTIVTAAIPSAAEELGLDGVGRQWVVTAYALAFGAALLVGGRIADYWGRKRTLIAGVVLFCAASAIGGVAQSGLEFVLARAAQGVGAALMAPAALSIVTLAYPSGRIRAIAFGVLGGVASSGAALGLILGGLLTETVGWRWCLLVNVPVGALAIVLAALTLDESRAEGPGRLDIVGALLVAGGLSITVYGLTELGGGSPAPLTPVALVGGVLLLVAFVLVERRTASPVLPLGILLNRSRGGALLIQVCAGTVMAAVSLYATLHLQQVLAVGPLLSGLAMLPLAVGIAAGIPVFVRASTRVGLRWTLVIASSVAAPGVLLLTTITEGGSYWWQILPGLSIMGVGMSGVFVAAQNLALLGVEPGEAGAASAASQAASQVGGALGLALLTNLFLLVSGGGDATAELVRGFSGVFTACAAVMAAAALIGLFVIRRRDAAVPVLQG
ncbi:MULTISPECIES: MFS transporter [unclassified Rathayibacter]|uniref:MFS transporter n=1 Tax=unclassified Rathayibacter TaxID=2609250 RepID=UPI000CE7B97F|nr:MULTISPECIES: MFS transporter [unclassified Rathayibacter]PPI41689.1 MFS transporter [Rathayibacter sp. RFBD1]PPI63190.1 MFS transporter [Rathayibacter sp. TRS19]